MIGSAPLPVLSLFLLAGMAFAQEAPAPQLEKKNLPAPEKQAEQPKPPVKVEAPQEKKSDPKRALRNSRTIAQMLAASGGYGIRATEWAGELGSDGVELISVQLYAGNEYQIVVGLDGPAAALGAAAFDARGKVLASEVHRGDGSLVFELKPSRSGVHRIRLRGLGENVKPVAVALTYVYK